MMSQYETPVEQKCEEAGWLDDRLQALQQDPEFVAGALALDITENALRIMQAQGINRLQMAKRMGVSRAYVTRLFNAPPNLTLETIARLALALGMSPQVSFAPLSGQSCPAGSPTEPASITSKHTPGL